MHPPSQYQARRLLELVSNNKTRIRRTDHIDRDVWGRQTPPLQGVVYNSRAVAKSALRSGALGAEPIPLSFASPQLPVQLQDPAAQLQDAAKGGSLGPQPRQANPMPRVESDNSRMSKISSVPSFGKMHEPLSGDSRVSSVGGNPNPNSASNLNKAIPAGTGRRPRAARPEYEEFGSEALITNMYDDLGDEYSLDAEASSRLFRDIGPSISIAHGIDKIPRGERQNSALDEATVLTYEGQIQPATVTIDMAPQLGAGANPVEQAYQGDIRLVSHEQHHSGPPPPPAYHPGAAPFDGPVPPPPLSPPPGPRSGISDEVSRLRIKPRYAKDIAQDVDDSSPVTEAFEQFEGTTDDIREEDVPDSDEEYPASVENGRIEEPEPIVSPYDAKVSSYGKDSGAFRRADRDDLPGRGAGSFASGRSGRRAGSAVSASDYLSRSEYTVYSEDGGSSASFGRSVEDDVLEEDDSIGRDYHDVDSLSDVAPALHYSNAATTVLNLT